MAPLATLGSSRSTSQGQSNQPANEAPKDKQAPALTVPFVRASDENIQAANLDRTFSALTTNSQDGGIVNIPSYGYLNYLYILVEATGGAAGLNNAVAKEDAPFSILRDVALTEPNGAVILSVNDGWQLYLIHKYGGYTSPEGADPKASPLYSAIATTGNFTFILRIPVAISGRDAVGALANQDSAGEFKLKYKVGATTDIYSTSPDTKPVVRVRAWMRTWDQPEPVSGGMSNQVEPPAHGTTSFWTVQSGLTIASGNNTLRLERKGNYLRTQIYVLRTTSSLRSNGQGHWPAETRWMRDSFAARVYNDQVWRHQMFERTGFDGTLEAKKGLDNGVRIHDYISEFDGLYGRENRDGWQPTLGSTRLELEGSFGAAGTLDVLTNDVAIANNVFL